MNLDTYDYDLPDELIARFPASQRTASRLLVARTENVDIEHTRFVDVTRCLREDDVLVLNDTRVVPARLGGNKPTGGRIELLLERVLDAQECLVHLRASKTPRAGMVLTLDGGGHAELLERAGEFYKLRFSGDVMAYFRAHGHVPLPPYLGREDQPDDRERYQTVYAKRDGAVAAPTAGLHFDQDLLTDIASKGVGIEYLTLHVGAGTFQNLRPENLTEGRLHEERVQIDAAMAGRLNTVRERGGRIVAVGTTTTRALESAMHNGQIQAYDGVTDLFIRPGYQFKAVDGLITNFHLPRSSLLMLLAAFIGIEEMQSTYRSAIEQRYRFYSYGDAMLAWRRPSA